MMDTKGSLQRWGSFEALESMCDALSAIDEEGEHHNHRSEGNVIEIVARRA